MLSISSGPSERSLVDDFELVDTAISALQSSRPTAWLIICDGNDYYDSKFLDVIDESSLKPANESAEVLAVGHWSK